MIPKKDSKPFLIKFAIGVDDSNDKKKTIYEDNWTTIYGLISEPTGENVKYVYGREYQFDKTIIVNASPITRKIKNNTEFLIDNMPTEIFSDGDYNISKIFPEYNGEIIIGLTKKESINIPKLYFVYNNQIIFYQLNFDKLSLNAFIKSNENIPFNINDYVWTKKPTSKDDTNNRLIFKQSNKTGFDSRNKNFIELVFVKDI